MQLAHWSSLFNMRKQLNAGCAMDLQAASRAASEAAARIDASIMTKLVKRARTQGMTEAEGIEIAEAFKRAARNTKRLRLDDQRGNRPRRPPGKSPGR